MKIQTTTIVLAFTLGVSALTLKAQDAGGPPDGRPHGHHRPPPLVTVLDANHDGVIDAAEIANASTALKALDKNNDGQLTRNELMPPRPEGTNNAAGAPKGPGKDGHRPPMPVIGVLDANHDGVIDAAEIANAPAALKALDKDGDGKLTRVELMPPRPSHGSEGEEGHGHGGPPPDEAP